MNSKTTEIVECFIDDDVCQGIIDEYIQLGNSLHYARIDLNEGLVASANGIL